MHQTRDGSPFWTDWVLSHNFRTFDMWTNLLASNEAYNGAQAMQNPPQEGPQ